MLVQGGEGSETGQFVQCGWGSARPRRGGEHMFTGGSSVQVGQVYHLTICYVCSETTGHGIVPPNPQKATFQGCLERRPSTGVPLDYPKSGTCSPTGQVLIYGRLNIGMSTVCSTFTSGLYMGAKTLVHVNRLRHMFTCGSSADIWAFKHEHVNRLRHMYTSGSSAYIWAFKHWHVNHLQYMFTSGLNMGI